MRSLPKASRAGGSCSRRNSADWAANPCSSPGGDREAATLRSGGTTDRASAELERDAVGIEAEVAAEEAEDEGLVGAKLSAASLAVAALLVEDLVVEDLPIEELAAAL